MIHLKVVTRVFQFKKFFYPIGKKVFPHGEKIGEGNAKIK